MILIVPIPTNMESLKLKMMERPRVCAFLPPTSTFWYASNLGVPVFVPEGSAKKLKEVEFLGLYPLLCWWWDDWSLHGWSCFIMVVPCRKSSRRAVFDFDMHAVHVYVWAQLHLRCRERIFAGNQVEQFTRRTGGYREMWACEDFCTNSVSCDRNW